MVLAVALGLARDGQRRVSDADGAPMRLGKRSWFGTESGRLSARL
jgi:hypothetical protein